VELDGENHCGVNGRVGGAFYRAGEAVEGRGSGDEVEINSNSFDA
jgi:hypothetical protein